ncbi:O-antigen ligase family protein [uncultured Croceitalea sp.]|uniref:O-antigen ligase family protein n=1 Tax=uncultured Croceitalea sp. TaxID=1798908 RepID=UPI0033063BFF
MLRTLNIINDYCLYLLVFSVTFEKWDPFQLVGTVSVTFITTILYFGTWVPLIGTNFQFAPFKKFVIPLLYLILVGFICSAINSEYVTEMKLAYNYRTLLLIVLMTFVAAHIYCKPKVLPLVLNSYVASMLLVSLLVSQGNGVTYVNDRLLLFGENPNVMGAKAALAFLIAISRLINKFSITRLIILGAICIPFIALVAMSGSRGAFISIFLGLAVLLYFKKMGVLQKWTLIVFAAFASVILITYLLETNPLLAERFLNTVEKGDTGRSGVWNTAFNVIKDNIIIGAGFEGVLPRMYAYSGGVPLLPHNVFLYLYIATGLPGIILFLIFLARLTKLLFAHFKRTGDSLNLVLFVIVVFNMAKQGGSIGKILFWFFFAVLIGSTAHMISKDQHKKIT